MTDYFNIKESDVVNFIGQNRAFGMTTNEVRIQFGMRYEKTLNILNKLHSKQKIKRYFLGRQIMWRLA